MIGVGMREEDWPTTPEGIAALIAKMDQIEPFLTPEEVVFPMVDMLLKVVEKDALARLGSSQTLYGDICGGTGRFVYALARRLGSRGIPRCRSRDEARRP